MALHEGDNFPEFALPNQDGETVKLSDFAGKWLVVYFYPKDDTPGCTIQGKSFTASKQDYEDAGVEVVGVSQDDVESHKFFCNKFAFTIDLLADTGHQLINAVGLKENERNGAKFWSRTSYVIDPQGVTRKIYQDVVPTGHEKVLLDDIKQLQAA
ncbi:MAG: peroxiredoxin [Chloroflexi bacterium]|mgnify:CR=1 FL=1|nr:peroxiredoxin [Chloroflexota bacterium]OJV97809.1 MAG: peroxiredoxin [Chloroflexi bacterium 54-19]